MKTMRCIKAFTRVLLAVLSFTLAGCQSKGEAQTAPDSIVNPISTFSEGLALTPPATVTVEISATPSNTPTPEFTPTPEPTLTPLPPPFLDLFVASLINGNAKQVVGVFVDGIMALKVVQQPASNAGYVSSENGVATYFTMVYKYKGNNGLLAHNNHAGIYYYDLRPGQSVVLIYGNGSTVEFVVAEIDQFQAMSPNDPSSDFVNISTGEALSAGQLFNLVYGGSSRTTFQTCIAQGDEGSWGRLFEIAPQE